MILGYTKWFNNEKGFGALESLDNIEYFLHINNIDRKPEKILVGTPFLFMESKSKGKRKAINAVVPETNIDFAIGINMLIQQKGTITYIVTIKGESRWGNPYRRRESRNMDTIGVFIRRISRDKGKVSLFSLFKTGFDENYNINWSNDDLDEYYNITKTEINKLKITLTEEEQKEKDKKIQKSLKIGDIYLDGFLNNKTDNEEVVNLLVKYYDSKLTEEDNFNFWHKKIKRSSFYGSEKRKVDISEELLLKNKNKLEIESIRKLTKYLDVSDNTFKQLVNPYFEQKIDEYQNLEDSLSIYNNLDSDLKPYYFKLLIEAITKNLYYTLWKEKKYFINHDKQSINSYWRYDQDFDLPRELYLEKIKEISISQLERIQKLRPKDDALIEKILVTLFNSQDIDINIFKRLIPILEKTSREFYEEILEKHIEGENSNLGELLKELDTLDLINLYKYFKRTFLYDIILNKLNLSYTYYFEEFIKHIEFSLDFGTHILNKINNSSISVSSTLYYLTYLKKEKFNFDISIVTSLFERNISFEELITVHEFLDSLNEDERKTIESLIASSIIKFEEIFDLDYIRLLKIQSESILEATLSLKCIIKPKDKFFRQHFQEKSDDYRYLEALFSNRYVHEVKKKLLLKFIKGKINWNEDFTLEFLINNRIALVPILMNDLEFNERLVFLFIKLFEQNKEVIRPHANKFNSNIQLVYSIVDTSKNKLEFNELNAFFKKNKYRFQTLILKYFISLFYNNQITKEKYISIQNSIEIKQLSALMIKGFINNSTINSREGLMELMNIILKEHFILINEIDDNKELFNNIYSISGLVKWCDGRKSFSGLEFWQGGKITRNYTDGNHSIDIGDSENIYCEGRFWKKERFYDSRTNKPLPESHDFYWCRNKKCVGVNDKLELDKSFSNWTLTEINKIFKIGLDRLSFVHLAGWLNRMDTIFNRLYCYDCENHLRPKAYKPRQLGHYGVPLFWCVKESCELHHEAIRFTHCRGCKKILDSRECDTCQNCNWLICDDEGCGKCGCGASYTPVYAQYD